MKKISSPGRILILNAYWIGLSFKWNALHPIILPAVLLNFVPETQKNTYLGALTFAGLLLAMVVQPVAGAVSDGWHSRWGRRRPLMAGATLFDMLFLALLAVGGGAVAGIPGGLALIFIGYVGLQFSSNIGQGPAQGLLPDRVALQKVGLASGIKTLMDMTALIIASLAAGHLLDPAGKHPGLIFSVLGATVLVSAAITIFFTPEEPTDQRVESGRWGEDSTQGPRSIYLRNLRIDTQLQVDFRGNTAYWWVIAQRFTFLLGIYGVQAFAQNYLRDALQVPNPVQLTGDLLAALTLALVGLAVAGGWLADRFGAKRILSVAGLLMATGLCLLILARTTPQLLAFGAVIGAGIGLFLTSSWALANRLAPAAEAGKYLGLTNIATAGAAALARLQGPLIDWGNSARPGMWAGYTAMFLFGALCAVASVVMLRYVVLPEGERGVSDATEYQLPD
jgi:MFS family permease